VGNGQPAATISNAQLNGIAIEPNLADHWNQTIANRIVILGQMGPNSTLKSISITNSAVTLIWTVTKYRMLPKENTDHQFVISFYLPFLRIIFSTPKVDAQPFPIT